MTKRLAAFLAATIPRKNAPGGRLTVPGKLTDHAESLSTCTVSPSFLSCQRKLDQNPRDRLRIAPSIRLGRELLEFIKSLKARQIVP